MRLDGHARKALRNRFDSIYDSCIVGGGFFESDEYYRLEKERYWCSLLLLRDLPIPSSAKIFEIGGGQMALLCKRLFGNDCAVGDISDQFVAPLRRHGIPYINCNLMNDPICESKETFDVVVLLEVIEHIPVPAYIIFRRLQKLLRSNGLLFLTTPNLFRLRNLVRMFLGIEFLDHFLLPEPGQGLGHQLEYSAPHLKWQLERAGMKVIKLEHNELGHLGHSTQARLARRLLSPLRARPIWRDELVAAALKA